MQSVSRCTETLAALLSDSDAEIRAQSAKVAGEHHCATAYDGLIKLLADSSARVRFFAAMSLGKLGKREAIPAIETMLRQNADKDPYLRHAGAMALTWIGDVDALIEAGKDESSSVRMGALLAMRRLQRDEIAMFVRDPDPFVVLEAARAINDEPVNGAAQNLAMLISETPNYASTAEEKEALLRRVLNANFHVGTTQTAKALAGYAAARREVRYGRNSRVDFLLEDPARAACYVEVKNVHLMRRQGHAEFPDAITTRGARHLDELAAMVAAGHRAVMLFLIQIGSAERFGLAADIDPAYARAFARARAAGVEALAWRCAIATDGIVCARAVDIDDVMAPVSAPPPRLRSARSAG